MAAKVTVKELNAVTTKIAFFAGERVASALNAINGTSVCSGIKGDSDLQKKARINHYGGSGERTTTVKRWESSVTASGKKKFRYRKVRMTIPYRLPERHFIDSAVSNGMFGAANRNIVEFVQNNLGKGHAREVTKLPNGAQYTSRRESAFAKGMGVQKFMGGLGRIMLENQKNALRNTEPNAPSTAKRKGKNEPMRDTYELYNGLTYWFETK